MTERSVTYCLETSMLPSVARVLFLYTPANSHSKSLWRRSQTFDIKGLTKGSLMDHIIFLNGCIKTDTTIGVKIQYHAARMISKQMEASCLFSNVKQSAQEIAYVSCNYKQQKYDYDMVRILMDKRCDF